MLLRQEQTMIDSLWNIWLVVIVIFYIMSVILCVHALNCLCLLSWRLSEQSFTSFKLFP